jgi:hypothetical protein
MSENRGFPIWRVLEQAARKLADRYASLCEFDDLRCRTCDCIQPAHDCSLDAEGFLHCVECRSSDLIKVEARA